MTADDLPAGQGVGVNSVPTDARCYAEIAAEDQRRELAAGRMGRWSAEAKPPLPPGVVPHLPQGSPWSAGDGFGTDKPVDINGPDPSGSQKHRGIGCAEAICGNP